MVAVYSKKKDIPVTPTRSDLSRELKKMLETKMDKVYKKMLKYENAEDIPMAEAMDWYKEGMEYAYACLLDLDEAHAKAYTVKVR